MKQTKSNIFMTVAAFGTLLFLTVASFAQQTAVINKTESTAVAKAVPADKLTEPSITKPAPKAAAGETKGALEVTGKAAAVSADPVLDQYRRKLSMALF